MPYSPERVPEDILSPIFEQLSDQRDLLACSLVSWTFNRAVTPILYRSWDTRVVLDIPAPGTRQVMTPRVSAGITGHISPDVFRSCILLKHY